MEGSPKFEFFCNDGASILHLGLVTLQLIAIRIQRAVATNVEHTKAEILSFSFEKVPEVLSECFLKVFIS